MSAPVGNPPHDSPAPVPQFTPPPSARGRAALGLTAAAAHGRFALQACDVCGAVQYPAREACGQCLATALTWRTQSGEGSLLATTTLHHSNDLYFRERLPWRIGTVVLDAGPTVIVHLHGDVGEAPRRVRVAARLDRSGQAVLVGQPHQENARMADDKSMRETASDPRSRKVLVTDGASAVGQAIVRALVKAGADTVWAGVADPQAAAGPGERADGLDALAALPQVALVPLDLADERSVTALAAEIAGRLDIVVDNAEAHGTAGIGAGPGTDGAKREMEINYFGLLRLAQAFGPALRRRAAHAPTQAPAWVNLLSICALANFPAHGTFSASKAAALSLAQCLRAEMTPAGVRVINVFPGPVDDEANRLLPPPKLPPQALATAIVGALRDGVEDVYPGDVAQEWLQRWRDDPKVLERELAAGGG